ncbi:Trimeric GatFAB AmidoTransferase(AdT) complex subunit [Rhodosporidiobolus nylandii]
MPPAQLPARVAQQLTRAAALNPQLNAFVSLRSVSDVERQHAAAQRQPGGAGRLTGRTVGVKDCFATAPRGEGEERTGEGERTGCASRMLQEYTSPFEATVVRQLREAGALTVGKTNMDEFGMGSSTTHTPHGPTLNPSHPEGLSAALSLDRAAERRTAGGSSGGSAAAVAAGLCDFALSTDTGGSTRLPASYTGVLGFKPSYGLLSRHGVVAYASSLDTVGILARAGAGEGGGEVLGEVFAKTHAELLSRLGEQEQEGRGGGEGRKALEGVRVGVPAELFPHAPSSPLLSPSGPLRRALRNLRSLGATLVPVRLRTAPLGLSAYYVLASAEASSNLGRFRGVEYGFRAEDERGTDEKAPLFARTRSEGFGKEVKKRVLLGTFALSAEAFDNYYLSAQRVRLLLQQEIDSLLRSANPLRPSSSSSPARSDKNEGVDFLLHPSALSTAPLLSSYLSPSPSSSSSSFSSSSTSPSSGSLSTTRSSYIQDLLSLPASLAGLPAISIPAGRDDADGWPVGVTLVGQWGADRAVLRAARELDRALRENEEEGEK